MTAPALKLNVHIGLPTYGGNGGIASMHPDVAMWYAVTTQKMKADPRVGEITGQPVADTPITMVRNKFVLEARHVGAHLLLMVDSDQGPQKHAGEPWYKPFWDVAFEEVYNHYQKGPLVIGAPYCGPPPLENVYVFQFESNMSRVGNDEAVVRLEQYTRSQAAMMTGIGEVAALPTGMILFDMRIFDLYTPSLLPRHRVLQALRDGEMTVREAEMALMEGWFHYEWKNGFAAEKASTEDVSSTRDMGMACAAKLGYNPLRCAWDSWIGHHKPWNCGKPMSHKVENVAEAFKSAVLGGHSVDDRYVDLRGSAMSQFPPMIPSRQTIPRLENGHARKRRPARR